jgi:hypothetical protein
MTATRQNEAVLEAIGIWNEMFHYNVQAFADIYNLDPESPQAYRAKAAMESMTMGFERSQAVLDGAKS